MKEYAGMLEKINCFFDHRDENGISNREKVASRQKVIRRVATTDKTKSYEASRTECDGIVLKDDRLIGFGIRIFNEDIYPLQSFEIYLRGCDLAGSLDLSGQSGLLFVDVYHNRISELKVNGASALRILGIQDNQISELDVRDLTSCQGIDAGMNCLRHLDVSHNHELVELYLNDNQISEVNLGNCPKLKYFYCHNNPLEELDTTASPLLRHLNATGCPLRKIRSFAPRWEERLPLELFAGEGGYVGLKYNPVYNAQWKETGEWQQTYYAYPQDGYCFKEWIDTDGRTVSADEEWQDEYGTGRVITAVFTKK